MTSYCEKAEKAVDEQAHVAVVLYGILEAEAFEGTQCSVCYDHLREQLSWLLGYREQLKKETDRQALTDYMARRFGGLLHSIGLDVDITSKIEPKKPKEKSADSN